MWLEAALTSSLVIMKEYFHATAYRHQDWKQCNILLQITGELKLIKLHHFKRSLREFYYEVKFHFQRRPHTSAQMAVKKGWESGAHSAWRRFQGNCVVVFQHLKGLIRKMGTDCSAGPAVTEEMMDANQKRENSGWIQGRNFLQWGWWDPSLGCPEKW